MFDGYRLTGYRCVGVDLDKVACGGSYTVDDLRAAYSSSLPLDSIDKAIEMSRWISTTLSKALTMLVDAGIPIANLWLEHQGTETRIMMGPSGPDSDADLRTVAARVWQDPMDLAHNRSAATAYAICLHYEGPDIGAVAFPAEPFSAATTDNQELSRRMVDEAATLKAPMFASTGHKSRSPRCQRCNSINSHGTSACYRCGGKRFV